MGDTSLCEQKKIVRIITRMNVGGPAKHVSWVSSSMFEYGWDTVLISGFVESDEDDLSSFLPKSVPLIYLPQLRRSLNPLNDFKAFLKIFTELVRHQPDVVHTHTSKAGLLGRLAAFIYRLVFWREVIIIHTFHGHTFHSYFGPIKTALFLFLERFLARICTDKIVTISRQQSDEILHKFKVGKSIQHQIIPLGINTGFAENLDKQKLRNKFHIPEKHRVIGIVGRIAAVKNHDSFLQVCTLLKEEVFDLSYIVIGGGSSDEMERLKSRSEDLGLNNIHFAGNVDVPNWIYGCLDILLLTSKNEGTPVSILEAFACRIPVVSTMAGGTVDLIGKAEERGHLVEQGPFQDRNLADKVKLVLNDPDPIKVESAYNYVISNYSISRLTEDLDKLYKA